MAKSVEKKVSEKTKAYLVKLSDGGGDNYQEACDYLDACCDWVKGDPIPELPESIISDKMKEYFQPISREEAVMGLKFDPKSFSRSDDIASCMPNSSFNGERYQGMDSFKELKKFAEKHNLEVEDGYEGYML